jgi:serine/threonine protein kinase
VRYVCPECGAGDDAAGACPADGAERAAVGQDSLLGTTIGSWRVARMLGAGGMGRVYVAVQPQIGARVAIKVLKRESAADPDVVERFFNEARAVNMIKHEAIVDVIDLGRLPDGAPYIVMEFLDGASLGAIVRRDKRLPLGTLARIVGEVLAALEAAHGKSIIHRDLKPDNVYVSPSGRVTVLDFGIAKLAAGTDSMRSTQTGSLLGTPAYMSPEQARSQPLDARADLYSVGVMLYEAATGTLPFVAQNLFDLLQMHVTKPPRPPRELEPEIPQAFEAVILRALAKDPADRFASAAEMRTALMEATRDLPQLALSSIVIPPAAPGREKKSDPLAETAASDSVATDKTLPSTPPAAKKEATPEEPRREAPAPEPKREEPAKPASVQLTRGTLFAMLGAAALLGLGGAALMMYLGKRDAPAAPHSKPVVDMNDLDLMDPSAAGNDAMPVTNVDAGEATLVATVPPLVDAGSRAVPVRRDAAVVAVASTASPPDAAASTQSAAATADARKREVIPTAPRPTTPETLEDTLDRLTRIAETVPVANLTAVDPIAEYKKALARAMPLGGKTMRMSKMTIHHANANGIVDVTGDGALEIFFSSPGLAKAGEPCYLLFIYEDGAARFSVGRQSETDTCANGVRPPSCSLSEIVQRAAAKGVVFGKSGITFNRFPSGWQVTGETNDDYIDDDCGITKD